MVRIDEIDAAAQVVVSRLTEETTLKSVHFFDQRIHSLPSDWLGQSKTKSLHPTCRLRLGKDLGFDYCKVSASLSCD